MCGDELPIYFQVSHVKLAMELETKRHEAELARLEAQLKQIRGKCKHPGMYYEVDPSGDSSESQLLCSVCGSVVK